MANVTSNEITTISIDAFGKKGHDLVLVELYIEHAWATNDKVFAADIGVKSICGILGSSALDSSNDLSERALDANDWSLGCDTRIRIGADVAGDTVNSAAVDDFIKAGSNLNSSTAAWLTLLCRVF